MTDYRQLLERNLERIGPSGSSFGDVTRRRDRKRRNQRISAGVVGMAVFVAAVWIVTSVKSLDRSETSVVPATSGTTGPVETGPAETGPAVVPPAETGPAVVPPAEETTYLLDLNTGETTPLPKSIADGGEFAASRDGSGLAYTARGDNGKSQIFVANLDGTGIEQVTHDVDAAYEPAWSPDGSKIAYIGFHDDRLQDLFVLDLATGRSTQLSFSTTDADPDQPDFGPWSSGLPSFTPDGASVVYNASRGDNIDRGEAEVRMVPVAGGESVTLMLDTSADGTSAFDSAQVSPDGTLLSYSCGWVFCVADLDGTNERVVGESYGDALGGGDWSPDGTRIAYSRFHGQDVFVADVATGQATYVAEGAGATWLDDHTLIVFMSKCYDASTGQWGSGCGG